MVDLGFEVVDATALLYAAGPTIQFKIAVRNMSPDAHIQAVMLRTQIRIEAGSRKYSGEEQAGLVELFGERGQWPKTVRSMVWSHVNASIPPFSDSIVADLPVPCTYDFEVTGARYLRAIADGVVPLLFLFSGTVLYTRDDGPLQLSQIPWEKEARFEMPARLWRETMDHYFPNSAWVRLRSDLFERLWSYKASNALLTWDDAFERLLPADPVGAGK